MATKKCPNGHQYDSSIYGDNCPFCPQSGHTQVNMPGIGAPTAKTEINNNFNGNGTPGATAPTAPYYPGMPDVPGGGGGHTVIRTVGQPGSPNPDGGRKLVGLLVSYSHNPAGEVYKIYEGRNIVGRDHACDISFPMDDKMSGRHLLILYREALRYLRGQLSTVAGQLCDFAEHYKSMPCLGYTHYQPAQLVTVGKRATLWLQDLMLDLEELNDVIAAIRFLGCRGTTGTEASFVELFDGDTAKIDEMNRQITAEFGFDRCYPVCGQTYPRKLDSRILNVLSSICQSACRMATDIRLLQHDRQVEEPFEDKQIGSSAMPYKRNPMRCERICSLARYVIADAQNAPMTAMTQWLERTLDDSANRRISLPEAFLATDGVLRLVQNVTKGLHVNEKIVEKLVRDYLPFIATENLMMAAVKRGGDRQQLHEIIREASMAETAKMKNGESWDLVAQLAARPEFGMRAEEIRAELTPSRYIGRCPEQVAALTAACRALIGSDAQSAEEIML